MKWHRFMPYHPFSIFSPVKMGDLSALSYMYYAIDSGIAMICQRGVGHIGPCAVVPP